MELSSRVCRVCGHCIWTGLIIISFALFLHPMNPDDFLALVLSDPLETIQSAYGIQAAILFWSSAALVCAGLSGLIYAIIFSKKSPSGGRNPRKSHVHGSTEYTEENWSFL